MNVVMTDVVVANVETARKAKVVSYCVKFDQSTDLKARTYNSRE